MALTALIFNVEPALGFWNKSTWQWYLHIFMHHWICLASIFLRLFVCKFLRDIGFFIFLWHFWYCLFFLVLLISTFLLKYLDHLYLMPLFMWSSLNLPR